MTLPALTSLQRHLSLIETDRTEVDIKGLIAKAKTADAEEKEYDEISINTIDDYCEENEEFTSSYPDEIFTLRKRKTWDIFSTLLGTMNPHKFTESATLPKEAIADYKENGIY